MLIFGHRGAAGLAPENTLLSIRRALELGVHGIEVDVHFVDGHLVVIHDLTVNRTTNGRGRLANITFERLRSFDAGQGETIPTLEEVVKLLPPGTILNVELKGKGTTVPVVELFEQLIREKKWVAGDILISSFNPQILRTLTGCGIPLAVLFKRPPRDFVQVALSVKAVAVNPNVRFATVPFVRMAHENGLRVFPYTANLPRNIRRLCMAGVDGMFTDYPDRAVAIASKTPPGT